VEARSRDAGVAWPWTDVSFEQREPRLEGLTADESQADYQRNKETLSTLSPRFPTAQTRPRTGRVTCNTSVSWLALFFACLSCSPNHPPSSILAHITYACCITNQCRPGRIPTDSWNSYGYETDLTFKATTRRIGWSAGI